MRIVNRRRLPAGLFLLGSVILGMALLTTINRTADAQESPLHPTFALLDENGESVLETGLPVSTMQTCGSCHDADFITQHSYHTDVGLSTFTAVGDAYRPWDTGLGLFGKWDPLTYRYLSPAGDERIDLTIPEWIAVFGARHAGGGPAEYGPDGQKLTVPDAEANPLEDSIVDPQTGDLVAWDWQKSGVVEMNCFLCHFPTPNNQARIETLQAGQFQWANTATLLGTGLVERAGEGWQWNENAFDDDGNLLPDYVTVRDPQNENCGQCHGLVHYDVETPLVIGECRADQWSTITTGQVFSPQRLSDTGLNLRNKETLSRSWDVHAERVISCTDCHYALNNPVYYRELNEERPDHLVFDPRRIDLGEYLYRPLHQFAKGQSAQGMLAPELDNTVRRCESCHDAAETHDWLPYGERHMAALGCASCHIPKLYAPTRQFNDWTVLQLDGTSQTACRGIEGDQNPAGLALLAGYEPVLLPRENEDGKTSLAPYNLITSWYWIYGDPARPVPQRDLAAVWLDGDTYHADLLGVFDANGDGQLDDGELVIDSPEKEALIAGKLVAHGLDNPRIVGEVQPYSINHDVARGEWAIKDCDTCHSGDSRVNAPILLADYMPDGVLPTLGDNALFANGELTVSDRGELYYQPNNSAPPGDLYVFGHDSVRWIDLLGAFFFVGTLGAVGMHGGLRYFSLRRNPPRDPEKKRVYMYSVYERQWHWLQTVAILLLIFTGLIIHKPDIFGIFSFRYVVEVHNVLAAILVINAALAAFYHFASGEIRQFLPKPHGFFDAAFAQARYYLYGIFHHEPHPFEKTDRQKMNPLQQVTYLGILNILLPAQIITGLMMWGAQTWPDVAARLGGLSVLAPVHTLVAWLFASFLVAHVYLTTTEGKPLTGINSMITGWSEVEAHSTDTQEA
jgi:thiosulfate reductase cytochrome b subunit